MRKEFKVKKQSEVYQKPLEPFRWPKQFIGRNRVQLKILQITEKLSRLNIQLDYYQKRLASGKDLENINQSDEVVYRSKKRENKANYLKTLLKVRSWEVKNGKKQELQHEEK